MLFRSAGMSYPGMNSQAKSYLWKTVGVPCLTYGMNTVNLSPRNLSQLGSTQGTLVKGCLGLGKRHRHSRLLRALNIPPVSHIIKLDTASLIYRLSKIDSPARSIFFHILSNYLTSGETIPGSLCYRMSKDKIPIHALFRPRTGFDSAMAAAPDGIADSLKYLLCSPKFNYYNSWEHRMVRLLTSAF